MFFETMKCTTQSAPHFFSEDERDGEERETFGNV